MRYGDFKDLSRGTPSDNASHDKAFYFAKIPKYDGFSMVLLHWFTKFLIKIVQLLRQEQEFILKSNN